VAWAFYLNPSGAEAQRNDNIRKANPFRFKVLVHKLFHAGASALSQRRNQWLFLRIVFSVARGQDFGLIPLDLWPQISMIHNPVIPPLSPSRPVGAVVF
jgi:hypothetical protein